MKRVLLIILCFVMLFSIPVSVNAAQENRVKSVSFYKVNAQSLKIKFKGVQKATSYVVFCSTTQKGGYKKVKTINNPDNSKKIKAKIKKLQPSTIYYFKVRALIGTKKCKCSKPVSVMTRGVNSEKYVIIRQNDERYKTIEYPYENNGKTIGSSGCGVCSALMVLRNTTNYYTQPVDFTNQCLATDCRLAGGSDMERIAEMMNMYYSMNYTMTDSNKLLKEHLEKGYMATAHVGIKLYFSNYGGHFVTVAGIRKGKTPNEDKAIILDPSFSLKKYDDKKRKKLGIEYTSDGLVLAPFDVLYADGKDEYYVLYTPEKKVAKSIDKPFIPTPYVPGENDFNK